MKTCSTCGSIVADDADVCPDCGMELADAAPSAPTPPASNPAGGSGFTVDFGDFGDAPAAPIAPEPPAAPANNEPFDFGAGGTVSLEKAEPAPEPAPEPLAPARSASITLKRGGALTNEKFVFGPGSIVGRFDPESGPVDVDLAPLPEASYVSRHHVEFRYDEGNDSWFVKDMGSRNGTFWRAGGQGAFSRISQEQKLQKGDEIALGNARFLFSA